MVLLVDVTMMLVDMGNCGQRYVHGSKDTLVSQVQEADGAETASTALSQG